MQSLYQVYLFNLGNLQPEDTISDTQKRKKGTKAKHKRNKEEVQRFQNIRCSKKIKINER